MPVGVQSGGRKIFQVDHSGYHHIPTTASQTASLGFIPASQLHLPWVPLHPKHITLFITSSQLDRPGYHGNLTTSLWVPPQPSAHPVSNPQPTPPSPSPQLFALVSQRPVPAGAGGGRIPWMALSSRCRAARACCLFSLCLTAALWILLLPRLWTVGPAQETQPNIYLPLFDLKQLQKGWKSVHQHPANPTFPPARESKHWKS